MNAGSERHELVQQMYEEGATLEEIGQRLGVTRERSRQLIDAYGLAKTPLQERRYLTAVTGREEALEEMFLELRSEEAVAEHAGVPVAFVRRLVDERLPDAAVLRAQPKVSHDRYTDDELVASLHAAAREVPSPMTHVAYDEWAKGRMLDGGRPWPGPQAAMLRFGGWRASLTRAGLPSNPKSGPTRSFDVDDCVAAVCEAWQEIGSAPTVAAYERWHASNSGHPSSATIRQIAGRWGELKLAAWPIVHQRSLPGVGGVATADAADATPLGTGTSYRPADEAVSIGSGDPFERDPQLAERGLRSHMRIQNEIAELVRAEGLVPLSPIVGHDPEFDLAWRDSEQLTVVEVKSATVANLESQLRLGLGQLLRYGQLLRDRGERTVLVLVCELELPDPSWERLGATVGVRILDPTGCESLVSAGAG